MQKNEAGELPSEEEMLSDMETIEGELPFVDYEQDQEKLRQLVVKLEKEYDKREKVINRILEYGTGVESEKALRMYPIEVLEKWDESLENFRAEKLKKKM